jgi:hypothetical protein
MSVALSSARTVNSGKIDPWLREQGTCSRDELRETFAGEVLHRGPARYNCNVMFAAMKHDCNAGTLVSVSRFSRSIPHPDFALSVQNFRDAIMSR